MIASAIDESETHSATAELYAERIEEVIQVGDYTAHGGVEVRLKIKVRIRQDDGHAEQEFWLSRKIFVANPLIEISVGVVSGAYAWCVFTDAAGLIGQRVSKSYGAFQRRKPVERYGEHGSQAIDYIFDDLGSRDFRADVTAQLQKSLVSCVFKCWNPFAAKS